MVAEKIVGRAANSVSLMHNKKQSVTTPAQRRRNACAGRRASRRSSRPYKYALASSQRTSPSAFTAQMGQSRYHSSISTDFYNLCRVRLKSCPSESLAAYPLLPQRLPTSSTSFQHWQRDHTTNSFDESDVSIASTASMTTPQPRQSEPINSKAHASWYSTGIDTASITVVRHWF